MAGTVIIRANRLEVPIDKRGLLANWITMLPRILKEHPDIALASLVASLMLSAWSVYADPVINHDGVRYLLAATDFTEGNWGAGLELYRWPFYSLLIATTSKLTSLSPEYSAHLVNAGLFYMLTLGFIAVVLELGADRQTLLLACLVILLFPGLNKFRPFIIRDAGHLAGYLWSLVYLFRYCRHGNPVHLVLWAFLTGIAALFRVEILIFLALVPLVLLFQRFTDLWQRLTVVTCGLALFTIMCAGLAMWIFGSAAEISTGQFIESPGQSMASLWGELGQQTSFRLRAIELEFLTEFSRDYAVTVMIITLLVIVVFESLRRLAFVYAFMAWYALRKGLVFTNRSERQLWLALVACHVAVLCVFTLATFFLDSRYTMPLVLTVLLAVPFTAAHVYRNWIQPDRGRRAAWIFPLMIAFISLLGLGGLDLRTDKLYVRDAGRWLVANTSSDAAVYSNNHLVLHYAGRDALRSGWKYDWQETMSLVWGYRWLTQDYLALEFDRDKLDRRQRIINQIDLQPEIVFSNDRGDNVSVFRIPPEMRVPSEEPAQ